MEGHLIGSIERKTFKSEYDAWNWVHEQFVGQQWYHDHEASKKAGYDIYRDLEEYYNYICCLGDRIEVNLKEGNQTINLWIKKECKETDCQSYDLSRNEVAEICDALYLYCNAVSHTDIQNRTYKNVDDIIYKLNLIKKLREGWENI